MGTSQVVYTHKTTFTTSYLAPRIPYRTAIGTVWKSQNRAGGEDTVRATAFQNTSALISRYVRTSLFFLRMPPPVIRTEYLQMAVTTVRKTAQTNVTHSSAAGVKRSPRTASGTVYQVPPI